MPTLPQTITALDLITSALQTLNILPVGEVPQSYETDRALILLNEMIDAWATEALMLFTLSIEEYPLVMGVKSYTIGEGGDFNTTRPIVISFASIVLLTNPSQPYEIPIPIWTDAQYQQVAIKDLRSTFPQGVYDDGGMPLRTLSYYPVPNQACKTRLYIPQQLTQFADLVTGYTFPPGYAKCIRQNLAVELAGGGFGGVLNPVTLANAAASKANIKSQNTVPYCTTSDPAFMGQGQDAVGGQYNVYTNRPVGSP